MRSTSLLSLFAVAVAACLGGCGDHGIPSPQDMAASDDLSVPTDLSGVIPDDAQRLVTFTMFAQDYAQAICAHAMACGQLDAAQLSACVERNVLHSGWDQDVEIMKGRMQINELQCLAAVKASRCDFSDSGEWTSKCSSFLYNANQVDGMPCVSGSECKSGYCQHGGSDAGMPEQPTGCPGVCATPKATGGSCRFAGDCDTKSFCDFGTTPHQCRKLAAQTESCTNIIGVGAGPGCQFGLSCPTFSATPTCQVPVMQTALHDACDPYQGGATPTPACPAPMYCQVQYTASTTACTKQSDCNALTAAYCDIAAGFCQRPTAGKCEMKIAAGADCDPNNENFFSFVESQCVDGATCDQLPGETKYTCHLLGAANAPCNSEGDCKVGFYCDAAKCTPWIPDHTACVPANASFCTSQSQQPTCVAQNADAGAAMTCEVVKSFGAACNPGFEDSLCEPSDLVGSTECRPNAGGSGGTCAPKCF